MDIKRIKIEEINPAPYNPRKDLKPDDPEYKRIEASIDGFGLVEPLVWNCRSKNLVGGHQRFKVLTQKGFKEIEVSVVNLDPEQEKVLNISLNKISGSWDMDKLAALLDELSKTPDFDIGITGFSPLEVGQIFDRYGEQKDADDFNFAEAVKVIEVPITKRGDLIKLGPHRLLCGDATSEEDLDTLLAGEEVALVDIDWPYNVNYMGGSCPRVDTRPKKSRKWDKIYSDNLPQGEYEDFMRKVLTNIKRHIKPGAAFYQWQAHRQLGPLYQILTELDFYISCLICWAKESAAISYGDYSFGTEQAVYGWLKGQSHYFAGKPGESNLWQVRRDPTKQYVHPCQKPVILAERAIKNSSKRNDVVLDVFLGSGSVLMASDVLDRRCFGMELDAKFCDAILRRYVAYKGIDSVSDDIRKKYFKEAANG